MCVCLVKTRFEYKKHFNLVAVPIFLSCFQIAQVKALEMYCVWIMSNNENCSWIFFFQSRRETYSRQSMDGKKSKSIEEREEEYKKARSRIFNPGSSSSYSSNSSKDGDFMFSVLTDG